jgi:hypothetical protein
MTVELASESVRVAYDLLADQALALREAGITIRLATEFQRLSWNRSSLWGAGEPGTLDGALESDVPVEKFREGISRRNVRWAEWKDGGRTVLLIPETRGTALRSTPEGAFIVSDLLGAGDFLGKFDRETIERKVQAGEHIRGGFTVYFLTPAQTRALDELPASAKSLR